MVVSDINLANTMGGKTARACDNCISKRARWYCPADDAFLCQGCDSSVHSANPLALRHERVRLKTAASMKHPRKLSVPSWHHGFTKKARTRRCKKHAKPMAMYKEAAAAASSGVNVNPLDLVPEICSDDNNSNEENDDEQVLYRVPILDPLCINDTNSNELMGRQNYSCITDSNQLHGSLPSEMELEEFAADVENLLGKGLDDESFDIEGLGFSNCIDHTGNNHDDHQIEYSCGSGQMKVEEGKQMPDHHAVRDPFLLSFDFDSSSIAFEDDYKNVQLGGENCKTEEGGLKTMFSEKKILLRLDYEGVLTAWSDQRSPWATGERPELDPNDCWPVCMGSCGRVHSYGHPGGNTNDGGREARVSRYREKRRTRLFTKKIRYEVRKLNAEKRPRMKGRFVKRANFSAFHSHDN